MVVPGQLPRHLPEPHRASPHAGALEEPRAVAALQALWSPDAALASGGGLSELGPGGARLGRARPASGRFWSKAWSTARAVASLLLGTSPRGKQGLGR